jgi:hypothetical protein
MMIVRQKVKGRLDPFWAIHSEDYRKRSIQNLTLIVRLSPVQDSLFFIKMLLKSDLLPINIRYIKEKFRLVVKHDYKF